MSRFDSLAADQKAVVQLLVRQGRSYEELAALLKLDAGAVRDRAHRALDALGGQDDLGAALSDERRHELSDWLLGQQSATQAETTTAFLAGSGSGRAWARTVGDQLRPVGGERIPDVPAEGRAAHATAVGGHRVSRRGGAFLIGGVLAAAAIVLVLVLVLGGGDDTKSDATATAADTASTTSTAAAQPTVKAQINLTAPGAGPAAKRAGILWILDASGQPAFTAAAQGLPTTRGRAYGIWLYTSRAQAKLIGGFDQYDKQGRVLASGALSADPTKYKNVIVTREQGGQPKTPGPIVLQGTVASATAPSAGTGTTTP
jgi:Sigma-70, region 4